MLGNRLKTVLLLSSLSGLLLLLGRVIGGSTGVLFALVLALITNVLAYFYSDKLVLALYKAQPLDKQRYSAIYATVAELAQKMAIPMPKLWLIETPMANAFATGRNPDHASVAVTSGILKILNHDELRGVLAHELAHVKNRDILISTIAATLATAISYSADFMLRIALWQSLSGSQNDRRRSNPVATLIVAILLPLAAVMLQLALSRAREYQADQTGARACNDPLALASALEKLHKNVRSDHLDNDDAAHASTAPLFIIHPFLSGGIMELFATHPPLAKRIERLRALYQHTTRS